MTVANERTGGSRSPREVGERFRWWNNPKRGGKDQTEPSVAKGIHGSGIRREPATGQIPENSAYTASRTFTTPLVQKGASKTTNPIWKFNF